MHVFSPAALRATLSSSGWSVRRLARELDMRPTTVSGWVNGRHRPSWGNVQRMAAALGVAPESLLRETASFTPGSTGAVPLSVPQSLILAVAVALVQEDAEQLAADWLQRLRPAEQDAILRSLVITPQWAWAWEKLARLGANGHPLVGYRVQVRLVPGGR